VIDAVRLTYAALRGIELTREDELTVRAVDDRFLGLLVGLDRDGRQHLLVESPGGDAIDSGVAAISTTTRELMIGPDLRRYLDVVCAMTELAEVFDHFVAAVAERAQTATGGLAVLVAEVLDQWRAFFAEMGPPPGRETLTAVIGELLFLRDVAAVDATDVLSIWVGPRGGRHDVRRRLTAVEVKATRSHTSRTVTIHGEDQLLPPEGGTLHLHFVRLEEVAGLGVSVTDLADELVELGVPRVGVFDALTDAGVPPAAFSTVGAVRFDVRERLTYPVDDETPRIVPATFARGERPQGIVDIVYRADLDHIAERALDQAAFDELLVSLTATGARP